MEHSTLTGRAGLITGAAKRLGAAIARQLHAAGMNVVLHYRSSVAEVEALAHELELARADSVLLLQADLNETDGLHTLVDQAQSRWNRLDALVNNASSFYPTPIGQATERDWDDLLGSNLKAPFFLAQAAAPYLKSASGCIVNMVDVHAERPRDGYPIYSAAKAGLVMLTQALAWELRPHVRVNAVAPGAILWSVNETADHAAQQAILRRVPLGRLGSPEDVGTAVLYLLRDGAYVNGQVLTVDGGRTVHM